MRITIFCAHPDDMEFSTGGVLLKLCDRHDVTLCVATDGGAGTHGDVKTRRKEQEAAAKMLGCELIWLGEPDCSIQHDTTWALRLARVIRETTPDAVFSIHPHNGADLRDHRGHPDHRNLGLSTRDAMRYARYNHPELDGNPHKCFLLYWYMVEEEDAKIAVVVDGMEDRLEKLWECHKTQLALKDGDLREYLLERRRRHAGKYDAQFVELLGADKPILDSELRDLLA